MNSPKFSPPSQSFGGPDQPRSSVAQTAQDAASKIGTMASETAARAKASAGKIATERKDSAAERVEAYGSAIHDSAKSLEEKDPNIAWLTHQAADRLEGVASYMKTRDLRGLREDAENLARRHPAAFFGGMCIAGLVLGSVIRAGRSAASSQPAVSEFDDSDFPTDDTGPSFEDRQAQGTATGAEI